MAIVKDFRIVARIFNNQLRERREATGLTACAFADSIGVGRSDQCDLESMKISPLRKDGRWTTAAKRIATALRVEPATLWPEAARSIRARIVERRLDAEEVAALMMDSVSSPFELVAGAEERAAVAESLGALTEREQRVLALRFRESCTLQECADTLGVSKVRVAAIEAMALRKLRHPSRSARLKPFVEAG